MNVSIYKDHHFQNSIWSGGTTKQLYIFPPKATYSERNFDIRISTAQVEIDKSNFTSLPGVNRKLMILDGEIKIIHQNQHSKLLKKFDVDSFKGDWNTSATGICADFNVMTTGNIQSDLSSIEVISNNDINIKIEDSWKTLFLYVHTGCIIILIDQKKYQLKKNELLVIHNIDTILFPIHAKEDSQLIVVKIN